MMRTTMVRAGGAALLFGAIFMALVAATHPTGHGHSEPGNHAAFVSGLVHAVAMFAQLVMMLGGFALASWFGSERPLGWFGLICFTFGAVSGAIAATMSGFITPTYLDLIQQVAPDKAEVLKEFARFSTRLNQAFGFMHMAGASMAILTWAIAWPAKGLSGVGIQIWGAVVGAGSLALMLWLVLNGLRLNTHMFGIYTLAQALWFAGAGLVLFSTKPEQQA